MNRLAVFPYNHDAMSIVHFRDMLSDHTLSGIFLPKEDRHRQDELVNQNVMPLLDFNSSMDLFDTLLLCDNVMQISNLSYADKITAALKNHKKILMDRSLLPLISVVDRPTEIKLLDNAHRISKKYAGKELLEPVSPITVVFGQGINCDKFDTELSFAQTIISRGYRPIVITSNPLGSLFGMFTYPDFMFENAYSFEQKIILMNQYIYDIDQAYRPDIIIIGIPGGYMPLDPVTHNHFGEFASIVASALPVVVDIGILTVYTQNHFPNDYFQALQDVCRMKLDISIDLFVIARQSFEYDEEFKQTNYYFYDNDFFKHHISPIYQLDYPITILGKTDLNNSFDKLIDQLESNTEMI